VYVCFSKAGVSRGCRWGYESHVCTDGGFATAASVVECCGVVGLENGVQGPVMQWSVLLLHTSSVCIIIAAMGQVDHDSLGNSVGSRS